MKILNSLQELPKKAIDALSLARDLTETLDSEQQIWLINWLQQHLWHEAAGDSYQLIRLEKLRSQLI